MKLLDQAEGAAGGAATGMDVASGLARELARNIDAFNRTDEAASMIKDRFERMTLDTRMEMLADRQYAIEEWISFERSASFEGALAQVLIALSDADCMHSWLDENDRRARKFRDRIGRCLYSAAGVLARAGGIAADYTLLDYYASARLDPLNLIDELRGMGKEQEQTFPRT